MKPTASAAPASPSPTPPRIPKYPELYERTRAMVEAVVLDIVDAGGTEAQVVEKLGDVIADCGAGIDDGMRLGQHQRVNFITAMALAWAISGVGGGRVGYFSNLLIRHAISKGAVQAISSVAQTCTRDALHQVSTAARCSAQIAAADENAAFGEEGGA